MFSEIIKKIQNYRGIKSSDIVKIASISSQQLSEFRNDRTDVTCKKLWSVIEAMDTLAPGAKADFAQAIANFEDTEPLPPLPLDPVKLVDSWSEEELNQILLAVANRYRKEKQSLLSTSTERNKLPTAV